MPVPRNHAPLHVPGDGLAVVWVAQARADLGGTTTHTQRWVRGGWGPPSRSQAPSHCTLEPTHVWVPGLVAQDHGLQGLLLAIQDNPRLQGVTLVLPVCREGLLQEDALRDGQSPRVPGVERGKQAEVIKAAGRVRGQLWPRGSDWACHCLAELRLCHRQEKNIRTHINPVRYICQSTPIHHPAVPSQQPSELDTTGVTTWQQRLRVQAAHGVWSHTDWGWNPGSAFH